MTRTRRQSDSSKDALSRAALAAALDPIVTIDAFGTIESASDSVARVFGWTPGELIGFNISVLMPEPHRSAHDGYLSRYAATGTTSVLNTRRRFEAQRKNGTRVPIELSVSRADIPTRAGPLFVGIIRDLTDAPGVREREETREDDERQRLQDLVTAQTKALEQAHMRLRLADRMVSIGTLAAGLGHDMNNVLLPVRAQIDVLLAASSRSLSKTRENPSKRGSPTPNQAPGDIRSAVQAIAASVAYLQQLADGLHYLAQNPDNSQPDGSATDLRDWWSLAGVVIGKAVPKHVKLSASFTNGLPPVGVSPHRLTQAVLNLVVNAGEAIPTLEADPTRKRRQGRVRLEARAATDAGGHTWLLLSVTDNGTGMTPEVKRRAFELFFTTKSRGHGTGLGLPLVHKVAAWVGGRVEIDSEVGKGTTVTMWLPAAVPEVPPQSARHAVVRIGDPRVASLVRHVLEAAGFKVSARSSAAVATVMRVTDSNPPNRTKHTGKAEDRRLSRIQCVTIPSSSDFHTIRDIIAQAIARIPSATR